MYKIDYSVSTHPAYPEARQAAYARMHHQES